MGCTTSATACPSKKFERELNISGILFPVKPSQITDFAKQNDISIDVHTLSDKNISPVHTTVEKN